MAVDDDDCDGLSLGVVFPHFHKTASAPSFTFSPTVSENIYTNYFGSNNQNKKIYVF